MPSNTACSGVLTMAKISRNPSAFTTARAAGLARIAFGSEPKSTPSAVG
jgi:hypothetical protein